MSFEFSPETFLAEIEFQIRRLREELIIAKEFVIIRQAVPLTSDNTFANVAIQERVRIAKKGVININKEITNLLDRKRLIETEIKVRQEKAPVDIDLDTLAPFVTLGTAQPKIDFKQLAIIGGIIALAG